MKFICQLSKKRFVWLPLIRQRRLLIGSALFSILINVAPTSIAAEPNPQVKGALLALAADGELHQPNDEVTITLSLEEQNKDKAIAASLLNQKFRQGVEIVKRQDPQAVLKTRGYYTYPIYSDETPIKNVRLRQPIAWRVGQYLEFTTVNLTQLAKTVAAAQSVLSLNGVQFRLSDNARRQLDAKLIDVTYKNLLERLSAVAATLGRERSALAIESINFDGADNFSGPSGNAVAKSMRLATAQEAQPVEEPSLEPGESTVSMRLNAKLRIN